MFTLAQIIGGGIQWSLGNIAIAVIVIAAVVGIVLLAMKEFGVQCPPWLIKMIVIVVVAAVAIVAIKFLLSL